MLRVAPAVVLLCASSARAAEPEDVTVVDEPSELNQLAVDLAGELGVISRSHATLTAGYSRRLWGERLYVEGRLGLGMAAGAFLVLEARGGAGLVFRPGARTELLVGWRVGDTYVNGDLRLGGGLFPLGTPYDIHVLAIELAIAIQIDLRDRWRLRALPLVPTVYWNGTYGGALGLELGVGRAF